MLLRCNNAFVLQTLNYFSLVWGAATDCHLKLLIKRRFCPEQRLLSLWNDKTITVYAGLCMLYKVNSNSTHSLFSELPSLQPEFDIPEL